MSAVNKFIQYIKVLKDEEELWLDNNSGENQMCDLTLDSQPQSCRWKNPLHHNRIQYQSSPEYDPSFSWVCRPAMTERREWHHFDEDFLFREILNNIKFTPSNCPRRIVGEICWYLRVVKVFRKATHIFFLQLLCKGSDLIVLSLFFLFKFAQWAFVFCVVDLQKVKSHINHTFYTKVSISAS